MLLQYVQHIFFILNLSLHHSLRGTSNLLCEAPQLVGIYQQHLKDGVEDMTLTRENASQSSNGAA